MRWLIGLLPKRYKDLLALGEQIISRLDTAEERAEAIAFGQHMLLDGKVTVGEWAKFGSKLGILRGRGKVTKQ
tara:strand:- start:314 stop:532 length:219 start_codon:yes stop_codon:yes gene_type:complete